MKTFLPFVLFAAVAAMPAQTAPTFRIGTWNLEFLGADGDFRNHLPVRDDADFAKIGHKVQQLGVAVLAVQEICGEAPLQKVAAAAGPSWRVLLGTTGGWDDGKTSQQIGFLWDSAQVELLHAEELLQLPRTLENVPIFHRVPVTACFRVRATGFDFRAVTVHLKAGQKAADEQKRRLEATQLHEWIASLQRDDGEDQDVVVLGDFNSTYGTEPQQALERGGSLQYVVPAAAAPTIMHFPEPIDQVAAGPAFDELRRESFTVHGDFGGLAKDEWRKTYSDHFPVTVAIAAAGDGDPQATFARGQPGFVLPASARPATAAEPAIAATPAAAWPPPIGTTVRVQYGPPIGTTAMPARAAGKLAAPLPAGPGGWLVLDEGGTLRAIPWAQIVELLVR